MRSVTVSAPWTWSHGEPGPGETDCRVSVVRRRSDYGVTRARAGARMLRDALELRRRLRGEATVVLATMGIEAVAFAALVKLRRGRTRVEVFDFLAPRREVPRWVARPLFGMVDRFLVIRSGDVGMLGRRFAVPADRCRFVAWPVTAEDLPRAAEASDYVYAAGWAHRDWPTLVAALSDTGLAAVIAPGQPVQVPEESRIRVIDMPSPAEGRILALGSSIVAVPMADTDLPSGPLVLLDAMAMGKAVVVTDVNGTRDYVRHGETALVVPPGDPEAMAEALERLHQDPALRDRLGGAARSEVLDRCGRAAFWEALTASCRG